MSSPVITLPESATFKQVVDVLVRNGISGAPVVDSFNRLIGILSEKDLLSRLFPDELDFYKNVDVYLTNYSRVQEEANKVTSLTARDIMRKNVFTISPDKHIMYACSMMAAHSIRRLPALENNEMVGIVSTNDVYSKFLSTLTS